MADLLTAKYNYVQAQEALKRALAINEKTQFGERYNEEMIKGLTQKVNETLKSYKMALN